MIVTFLCASVKMDLSSYVQALRVLILLTIVTCNCKGQILSQNKEAAFSNDKPNESSEHTEAEPAYTQPSKESDDIQATELPDHMNAHRRKLIHKQKLKPKPTQSLNVEHKEYPFHTSKVLDEHTQEYTPSVGRARGYYGFPTGKHRNKKRYIDFRPLNGKSQHDLQLRDNLSFGSIDTDGVYHTIDKNNYELPKLLQSTAKVQYNTDELYVPYIPKKIKTQSTGKHRYEQSQKYIYPTKTGRHSIHSTRKVKYPTKKGLSTSKKQRNHPKPKVKDNRIYVHGGGVTYIMNKEKLKGVFRPIAEGVESGGQGSGDDAGQFLTTVEPYDMESEDAAGTTSKLSTRCSTAEPLPKLDPTYIPNETLEKLDNELGDNQDSYYVQNNSNSNYIPPNRVSTPRHYIDDA